MSFTSKEPHAQHRGLPKKSMAVEDTLNSRDENRMVIALQGERKRGIAVSKACYERLSAFILDVLHQRSEIYLHDLLDEAARQLSAEFKGELCYYLLIVKNDLEERKAIKVTRSIGADRTQLLRLKRKTIL